MYQIKITSQYLFKLMPNITLDKRVIKIGKILFIALWAVWLPLQVLTGPIPIQPVKEFYSNLTGIPISQISDVTRPGDPNSNLNAFDRFSRSPELYTIMTWISGFVVIFGLIFLAKGRALFEKFLLLQVFALPVERESWGKVYDSTNNNPVPFSSVRLIRTDHSGAEKIVAQTVADLDGRYRLYSHLEGSDYEIEVKAQGYEIYRNKLNQSITSSLVLVTNIPLQPANLKPGFNLTHSSNTIRNSITNTLIVFIYIVALLPGTITVYNLLFHFGLAAVVNAVLYGYAVPWNTYVLFRRVIFRPGKIIDSNTGLPLEGVTLEVFKDGKHILSAITDKSGIPKFDLELGKYSTKVSKQGYSTAQSSRDQLQEIDITKEGFLNQNISLVQVGASSHLDSKLLLNPFA